MPISITRYAGTNFARISNPDLDLIPPQVVLLKLKGAADVNQDRHPQNLGAVIQASSSKHVTPIQRNPESPEINLLWAILEQTLEDLALISREHINADTVYAIKSARLHIKIGSLWYCRFLGLEPDYVRRVITDCGYLPPITWRIASKVRVDRWNLDDVIRQARRRSYANRGEYAFGSKHNIERLIQIAKQTRV